MARAHRTDAETAIKIGMLEPSERISNSTLARLTKSFARGPQTSIALQVLADRSSFLPLPPGELPPIPAPDAAKQQKLLDMARKYALETLPRLPNMFATRTTYSFDDSPQQVRKNTWPVEAGLHLVDIAKAEVNVRNEKEEIAAGALSGSHQPKGMMTWGEFGSALLMVLDDSAKGRTTWSHWELFPGGPVAVFDYSVPESASHYEIATPVEQVTHIDGSNRWLGVMFRATGRYTLGDTVNINRLAHTTPAYHGSLWIDPASGTILRITIVAAIQGNSNLDRAAILVDYGPVQIGDKSFVCPIRSFALSDAPANVKTAINGKTTEWLNENLFTNYHLFATSTRIVSQATGAAGPTEAEAKSGAVASQTPETPVASSPHTIQTSEASSAMSPSAPPPANQLPAVTSPSAVSSATQGEPAGASPTAQPPSTSAFIKPATQPAPNSPTAATPPIVTPETPEPDTGSILRIDVNAVLVPVVVRDKHGKSIDDLQKQDFLMFDDGKPRPLSGFLVEKHAAPRKIAPGSAPRGVAAQKIAAPQTMPLPGRFTVFVFDDLHLTADQVAYAQKAAIETLEDALGGSDLAAIVTTSDKINSGLTRDRTILTNAIRAVRPDLLYRPAAECPKLNYYQADLIANKQNSTAIADAVQQYLTVCNPTADRNIALGMSPSATPSLLPMLNSGDPLIEAAKLNVQSSARLVLQMAEQDMLSTYAALGEFVKKMGILPGQRTMLLISPGFPSAGAEAKEAESSLINLADQAGVTISALNASGLSTNSPRTGNSTKTIRNPVLTAEYRERETQDEENAIWDLADGTGGRFFHDNNDLAAGFRELLEAPETVYLLELPLNGIKQNGAWHRLSVKTDRAGLQVQARSGYFAPSRHAKHKPHTHSLF